ncbi:hypothetical protein LLO_0358 [Legionella longbeachae NSW150]|uniref:Uncharacterized protein n=1 Tax=Legionella longbeachae serogroup 1 (strain NSW150) TaxID=661367 RepID=D3HP73_LEGLN|nr:hypothetical protein LLO_0358 [Legionella longbeachae NSW150]
MEHGRLSYTAINLRLHQSTSRGLSKGANGDERLLEPANKSRDAGINIGSLSQWQCA